MGSYFGYLPRDLLLELIKFYPKEYLEILNNLSIFQSIITQKQINFSHLNIFNTACKDGYLDLVKYLYDNNYTIGDNTINYAAEGGSQFAGINNIF